MYLRTSVTSLQAAGDGAGQGYNGMRLVVGKLLPPESTRVAQTPLLHQSLSKIGRAVAQAQAVRQFARVLIFTTIICALVIFH